MYQAFSILVYLTGSATCLLLFLLLLPPSSSFFLAQKSSEAIQKGTAAAQGVRPKVLVATIKVGNCGITLTSATRVFLMEPCLDPAHEIQCAGRIHRLGQTKDVLCKRYCMKNSIESGICALHEQMKVGTTSISDSYIPARIVRDLLKE